MSRLNRKNCPLCGGRLGAVLLTVERPDRFELAVGVSDIHYKRVWKDCDGCGAAINCLPADSVQKLRKIGANYYEVDFGISDLREKYNRVLSLPIEKSDNAGRVERIHRFLECLSTRTPGHELRKVLDIGAGLGVFLSAFLQKGWKGLAIEPDPIAVDHLRSLNRFQVFGGFFKGQPELVDFDLITLNKVIEHILNPLKVLQLAARALKGIGGVLYVEVPDRETIGCRPPSDNILGSLHCHLHTPLSLILLLERAGLCPVKVQRVIEPSGKITVYAFAISRATLQALAKR